MNMKLKNILAGAVIGIVAILLVFFGNPVNMGICSACFLRDIAGGLNLHHVETVSYIRPEIIGIILGAFLMSYIGKSHYSRGGSSVITRFVLAFIMMIGCLVFLGCPFRMFLRIAGGDLNAVIGLVGFVVGIYIGTIFLKKGFSLEKNHEQKTYESFIIPIVQIVLLVLLLAAPAYIIFASKGPASMHAPIYISLIGGLVVGAVAQRSGFCSAGGIKNIILFKDFTFVLIPVSMTVVVFVGNILLHKFNLSLYNQPIAHTDALWNFLSMCLVGLIAVLLGGCPMRQLVMSGEGNNDSSVVILGLIAGAAFSHNFSIAASGEGVGLNGKIAVIAGFIIAFTIALLNLKNEKSK